MFKNKIKNTFTKKHVSFKQNKIKKTFFKKQFLKTDFCYQINYNKNAQKQIV